MSPVKYKIIHKRIHSPEADALADSFARAAGLVRAQTGKGSSNCALLDSYRPLILRSGDFGAGTLRRLEQESRTIQVDIEELVPVYLV
jgi:hypothetical protein